MQYALVLALLTGIIQVGIWPGEHHYFAIWRVSPWLNRWPASVINASALETLESLIEELRDAGVEFHLADIKGPVMDRLKAIGFVEKIGADHIHLSTHEAMTALSCT